MSQKYVFRILACIMTVLVAALIAAPELSGGHVTNERLGYVTGRVLIAFVVGGFLASGTNRLGLSFHWRLNIAALAVGLITFYVAPAGAAGG